ncbi:hypothetical protein J6T93_00830 [bacterium]|nr:hypothetical protein [bacterium]
MEEPKQLEEQKRFTLPWYAIVGLMVVLSIVALLLFARPLNTELAPGETIPQDAITGPAKD